MIVFGNRFKHSLRQLYVSVLVLIVGIPGGERGTVSPGCPSLRETPNRDSSGVNWRSTQLQVFTWLSSELSRCIRRVAPVQRPTATWGPYFGVWYQCPWQGEQGRYGRAGFFFILADPRMKLSDLCSCRPKPSCNSCMPACASLKKEKSSREV